MHLAASAPHLIAALLLSCTEAPEVSDSLTDTPVSSPRGDARLSKAPWSHLTAPGSAILRFETREPGQIPVLIDVGDGPQPVDVHTRQDDLTFERPTPGRDDLPPDLPGVHYLHTAELSELAPGTTLSWRVYDDERSYDGSLTIPDPDDTARIAWIADTMWPNTGPVVGALTGHAPHLVLHGGDIEYESNPGDTWSGFFNALEPLTSIAPIHLAVGNHEFEFDGREITEMYERLFEGQGDSGEPRYHAFTFHGVRILLLDSETVGFSDPEDPQIQWAHRELQAAEDDPEIRWSILGFHRPTFSLSKHYPSSTAPRETIHSLAKQYSVPLVMAGHAHAFEHFVHDGVHYVVDGGAGALLYDPDERRERAVAERPQDIDDRQTASRTYGATLIDIPPSGPVKLQRIDGESGEPQYAFEFEPPS